METDVSAGQERKVFVCLLAPCVAALLTLPAGGASFIRGDANQDGRVDIGDPQFTLNFLFLGGPAPQCLAAADSNDDEVVDISDALASLGFLFLGSDRLPPPGPVPGTDPTPGLGCGFSAPENLSCRPDGPAVVLLWTVAESYDSIEVSRDGATADILPGDAVNYTDHPPAGGSHAYAVQGMRGSKKSDAATCRVTNIPTNQPPTLVILSPAQGFVADVPSVEIQGRVSDDNEVVRIVALGADVTPAGLPAVPYNFTATVPLVPGPNIVRVEAVDDFGRATFKDVAVGRRPILPVGARSQGVALDLSGTTGYGEIESIVRPFLNQVPALLNGAIAGAVLYEGSVVGVDIRVTGNRVEVSGAIGLDFFPSPENGGRLGLSASFQQVKLFANGRSDYGFLGTDSWDATWTGNDLTIRTLLSLIPLPGGVGLDVVSDGFTVEIASSSLSVSGFLDPFGIFDALVNFLADIFRADIETAIKNAVQMAANDQIIPVLEAAFSNLKLNLDLGTMQLDTIFHDVLESGQGLSFLFDAAWTGAQRDPAFPPYPGSTVQFAPYPVFPLPVTAPHAVDATISLSADTLNQALYELTSAGLIKTTVDLSGVQSPVPLLVGTLASILDERLLTLPEVGPDNPLGVRVEAEYPAEIRLAEGAVGRQIIGEGAIWRYLKGTAEPPGAWKTRGFDDAAWDRGPSGFGYSTDASELRSVRTELSDMGTGAYTSLYTRVTFNLENPATLAGLLLHATYDDGFVAYLNGTEVARVNMAGPPGTPPAFNALAATTVEPAEVAIDLAAQRGLLRAGENVLAVQGHNAGATSSDFVLVPALLEPAPPPAGTLSQVPAVIEARDLVLTFVADTKADGVGDADADHVADEVDLFALKLGFRLQARLLLARNAGEAPEISFQMLTEDGPDPDVFPDAIVGGAQGLTIGVARESIDMRTTTLIEFAELILALFGPSLGEALAGFELPSFPLPELAFDLDGNGVNDVRLDVLNATFAPVDTNGDRRADWICILTNLRAVAP